MLDTAPLLPYIPCSPPYTALATLKPHVAASYGAPGETAAEAMEMEVGAVYSVIMSVSYCLCVGSW